MYPPLVVGFALAGNVTFDLKSSPLRKTEEGGEIRLDSIWPQRDQVLQVLEHVISLTVECLSQVCDICSSGLCLSERYFNDC